MSPVVIGIGLAVAFGVFLVTQAIRVLPEYERGVVFRLGRLRGADGHRFLAGDHRINRFTHNCGTRPHYHNESPGVRRTVIFE